MKNDVLLLSFCFSSWIFDFCSLVITCSLSLELSTSVRDQKYVFALFLIDSMGQSNLPALCDISSVLRGNNIVLHLWLQYPGFCLCMFLEPLIKPREFLLTLELSVRQLEDNDDTRDCSFGKTLFPSVIMLFGVGKSALISDVGQSLLSSFLLFLFL